MQQSRYGYSDKAEIVNRLLEEIGSQIDQLNASDPDSVRMAAILQHGDMMVARQAALALEEEVERDGLLSVSYCHEAQIKYRFLAHDNNTRYAALACIQKAISLLPNPYYYFIEANIHADIGERDKAIQSLEKAVEIGGSAKEEMQTELARMKNRFTLEDSRKNKTIQEKTPINPKIKNDIFNEPVFRYSSIVCITTLLIVDIINILSFNRFGFYFLLLNKISHIFIFLGIIIWIRKYSLRKQSQI